MSNQAIGVIGACLSGAAFIHGCLIINIRNRLRQQSSRIDLHWAYLKSLHDSLDTLKQAIEAVDAKVDGKGATDHDTIHTP